MRRSGAALGVLIGVALAACDDAPENWAEPADDAEQFTQREQPLDARQGQPL